MSDPDVGVLGVEEQEGDPGQSHSAVVVQMFHLEVAHCDISVSGDKCANNGSI